MTASLEQLTEATKRSAEAIGAGLGRGAGDDWAPTLIVDGERGWMVCPMTGELDALNMTTPAAGQLLREVMGQLGGRGHRAAMINVARERHPTPRELLILRVAEPDRGQTWIAEISRPEGEGAPALLGPWSELHDGGIGERHLIAAVTP